MKILILSIFFAVTILVSGCAHNSLSVGSSNVDRYFHKGTIESQRKVMINDTLLAVVTGAGTGAVVGAVVDSSVNGRGAGGAGLGAVVGGLMGYLKNNETVAYETKVISNGSPYVGYLKNEIKKGQTIEFTVKDNRLENVNIINANKDTYAKSNTIYQPNKKQKNDTIIEEK